MLINNTQKSEDHAVIYFISALSEKNSVRFLSNKVKFSLIWVALIIFVGKKTPTSHSMTFRIIRDLI